MDRKIGYAKHIKNAERTPSIIFCGDTFLSTKDGAKPFSEIEEYFKENWVCINMETSLKTEKVKEKVINFCIEQEHLDLIGEKVRIVSIVNNHVWDSGNPNRLVSALVKRGKYVIGPNNPSRSEIVVGGLKVGFFSAYFHLPRLRLSYSGAKAKLLERMIKDSNARPKILNLHWGYEHTETPAPFQRKLGYSLIDAGADIIIGHHPHAPQGYEIYKGKPIYYSLGNFNFWQFDTVPLKKNRWGYMVKYNLENGETKTIPYRINQNYQPCRVSAEIEEEMNGKIERLSSKLKNMETANWLRTEYDQWFKRELKVWCGFCFQNPKPKNFIKWAMWLCLPMQMKYYYNKLAPWFSRY